MDRIFKNIWGPIVGSLGFPEINRYRGNERRESSGMLDRLLHPRRRGIPDPTWSQVAVAMIALGSFSIALSAATAGTVTKVVHGVHGTTTSVSTNPQPVFLWFGGVVAGVGVLAIAGLAVIAFFRWTDDRRTPFVLFHDPSQLNCDEISFRDEIVGIDTTTQPPTPVTARDDWRQVRVGVINQGPVGVQRVRAYLEFLDGAHRNHFLHLQHDNDPQRYLSRNGEYLTTGETAYFDLVLAKWVSPWEGLYINYADTSISEMSRVKYSGTDLSYQVRVTVSGWSDFRDVVSVHQDYKIEWDGGQGLSLVPLGANISGRASHEV